MTEPTPVGDPPPSQDPTHVGGATRAPLAEGENPEATPLAQARKAYAIISDVLSPKRIALLLAGAALLLSGSFGGWDQVEAVEKEAPTVAVGATTTVGPFDVAIQRAYVTDAMGSTLPKSAGKRYLIVVADVRTTGNQPQDAYELKRVVALAALGLAQNGPAAYRLSDGGRAGALQPSLTYQVALAWEQATSAAVPAEARVLLSSVTWRRSSNDGSYYWLDPEPAGSVTLPLRPLAES